MTSWGDALPPILVAVAILVVPGAAVGAAGGLRGIPLLGLGPALSVSVVALAAVVAGAVGVPFGLLVVVTATLAAAAAAGLGRLALGVILPRAPRKVEGDGATAVLSALGGALAGGACAALAVARGIPRPDAVPQTFDAVFHLGAVWRAVHSGDASSLTLGTLTAPERAASFYPGAWHAVTILVVEVSGAPVPVAANVVSLVVAAVVWPLGIVFLSRVVLGADPGALVAAGVLSAGLAASPYLLLSYGTLWPNALGTVLIPPVLACVATLFGGRVGAPLGRRHAVFAGLVAAPGLALAHPNALVSALMFATIVALAALWSWAVGAPDGHPSAVRVATATAATLTTVLVGGWVVARSPIFAATRGTSWPARQTVAQAVGEWLMSAPMRAPVPLVLAGLVVIGSVVALRRPDLRWLVACHVGSGAVFVAVAGSDSRLARALSSPWWDDPFRLGALLGVTAVPLAALGLRAVGLQVARLAEQGGRTPTRVAITPLFAAAVLLATGGMYAADNARLLSTWYRGSAMVGPDERAMLERLPTIIPAGAVIAGSPWNGSALAQPLGDRQVLFPHLVGSWGTDRTLVASRLAEVAQDPAACAAVRRLGVGYVISGRATFWADDRRQGAYRGLDVAGTAGFVPVDHGGRLTLYRITLCQ